MLIDFVADFFAPLVDLSYQSDERAAETAMRHFADSKHGGKIRLLLGKAMDSIDQAMDSQRSYCIDAALVWYTVYRDN